jgi:hypothetical protein
MYEGLAGNKNAEKWTEENVSSLLSALLQNIEENELPYIGSALKIIGLHKITWTYFQTKFKDNETVLYLIKRIEETTETNLVEAALSGKVKETMAIFVLKSKYKWIDKQVIETEQKGSIRINLQMPEDTPIPH